MENSSKAEAKKVIDNFFKKIKTKTPKEIKKIKKISKRNKIPLAEKRKLFCKQCLNPYLEEKIRVKKGKKTIVCAKCGKSSRWKVKTNFS
jgi:RNase P subunit RPR2